ncbi:ferredoxin [Ktedonospora formicarum]|uniref:Ferredoxin n=1 Tax=Ktedonospora formicarum TaxID=2778364 RepID=A0A8J3IBL4_9CHLR|nr:ferredoxin [Ktedonospora formicarum]GHO50986.1 ferredoxin [Ktedonospora formicarum]
MRVIAQTQKCIASGTCVLTCPQVFDQRDEDGTVQVVDNHPPLTLRARIMQAVDLCPAQVFQVENEDETEELIIEEDPGDL